MVGALLAEQDDEWQDMIESHEKRNGADKFRISATHPSKFPEDNEEDKDRKAVGHVEED